MLPHEVSLALSIDSRQVDCAFAFDEADDLGHGVFWRNRDHHVHMVRHQMSFNNATLPLRREISEYFSQMRA
jgi:hypothetical protein